MRKVTTILLEKILKATKNLTSSIAGSLSKNFLIVFLNLN